MSVHASSFALLTGASHGLGKAMAGELASRKINLLLVSLPNDGLAAVAISCRQTGIEVHTYETDLAVKENILDLAAWADENFNIFMLINNAGFGGSKRFLEADIAYLDKLVQLNANAVALLTHQLLPNLLKQKEAYILNVSSIAAFSPVGFKTVYPATKKFVQHFSLGLREELKDTGVSVSVVYPGPMITSEEIRQRTQKQGWLAKQSTQSPERVAAIALRGLLQKRPTIIPGLVNRFFQLLAFLPTSWKAKLATNAVKREVG